MSQFNKNNQMNNTEHQQTPNLEPKEIKKTLIERIKAFFTKNKAENQGQILDAYLQQEPEILTNKLEPSQSDKDNRTKQQQRLSNLKQALHNLSTTSPENTPQLLLEQAKQASIQLAHNTAGFHGQFYQALSELDVKEEQALPYARYLLTVTDVVSTTDPLRSAQQKIKLALEIFVGETGQPNEALPLLKQIINKIAITHDAKTHPEIADYFQTPEFVNLCQYYGMSEDQITALMTEIETELLTTTANNVENDQLHRSIPENRQKILEQIKEPSQAVIADTYLLSLNPLQFMQLLRAQVRQRKGVDSHAIHKFVEQMLSSAPGLTVQNREVLKTSLNSYYQILAEVLDRSYQYIAPERTFFGFVQQDMNVLQNIVDMDDKSLAAYTEFAPILTAYGGPQLFVEYYRGKVAEIFQERIHHEKKGQSEDEYLRQLLANGQELTVSSSHFEELFKETRKLSLLALIQGEYSNYYSRYNALVTKYKTDPYVKAQLFFGNHLPVAYEYQNIREDSFLGEERIRQIETVRQTSLAYIVPLYLKAEIGSIKEGFEGLQSVIAAAQKGDPAALKEAGAKLSNETMEGLMAMPEVRTAYQTYMSIVMRRLAANGNILTPDMFKIDRSGKNMLDYQLEQDLKNLFPRMTDEERTIISTLGKGLTIASGDFLWAISRATPPIRTTLNQLENSSAEVGAIVRKIREGKQVPTMAEFALVKEALRKKLGPSFHDFPFRELLFSLNPYKWAAFWVVVDDYNLTNLAFAPIKLGERLNPVSERWQMGYEVWRSMIYGIPEGKRGDKIAAAINEHLIPSLALDDLAGYMSLSRRAGWRTDAYFFSPEDLVPLARNKDKYDLMASFQKILRLRGPTAAWQFANSPLHRVDFNDANGSQAKALKKDALPQILKHLYLTTPTFFLNHEQSQLFREGESFVELVEHDILKKIIGQDSSVLCFLSSKEQEQILSEANVYGQGGENLIRARRVYDRLLSAVEFAEQALIADGLLAKGHTFADFINNSQAPEFALTKEKLLRYLSSHLREYYSLQADPEALFKAFISFNQRVFYQLDSLFKQHRVFGLQQEKTDLLAYYRLLIQKKKLDPFGWEYLYDKDLYFQEVGAKLIGRNVGDLGVYIELTKVFGELNDTIIAAMQKKNQKEGFEMVKNKMKDMVSKFKAFKPTFGDEGTYKAAATMIGYVASVFRCPQIKDLPLIGKIIPYSESYATFSFPDDRWKQAAWGTALMKELVDTLDKEGLFPYGKANFKVSGMSETPQVISDNKVIDFKLPEKILGVKVPEQWRGLPAKFLAKILPAKAFPGLYRNYVDLGVGKFTVDNIRKWANVDEKYVNINLIATVVVIGFLMMLFAAIKEGMKEAEIK